MLSHLINGRHYGVFNCVNTGTITPYYMAKLVKSDLAPFMGVTQCEYEEYVQELSVRRVNTLLSCDRLQATGFWPRDVKTAFDWCLENYG